MLTKKEKQFNQEMMKREGVYYFTTPSGKLSTRKRPKRVKKA